MVAVDLIPAPRRAQRKRRTRVRVWAAAVGAYGVVLGGLLAATATAWETDDRTPAEQLAHMEKENELRRRDTARLASVIVERQRELAANLAVENQPDWSILLALLAKAMGQDAALRNAQLSQEVVTQAESAGAVPAASGAGAASQKGASASSPRTFVLRLTGLARSQQAVSSVVQSLESSGVFSTVELQEARREAADGSDAVAFTIFCRLGGRAGR